MSHGLKVHLCLLAMYCLVIFSVKSGLAAYIDITKQLSNIEVFVAIQLTQTCAAWTTAHDTSAYMDGAKRLYTTVDEAARTGIRIPEDWWTYFGYVRVHVFIPVFDTNAYKWCRTIAHTNKCRWLLKHNYMPENSTWQYNSIAQLYWDPCTVHAHNNSTHEVIRIAYLATASLLDSDHWYTN